MIGVGHGDGCYGGQDEVSGGGMKRVGSVSNWGVG